MCKNHRREFLHKFAEFEESMVINMGMKKNIVAVDDSGIILKMLETLLSRQYEFHAFSKGMRALKYLKEVTPDLIILDIEMPEIDGFEIMRLIKDMGMFGVGLGAPAASVGSLIIILIYYFSGKWKNNVAAV